MHNAKKKRVAPNFAPHSCRRPGAALFIFPSFTHLKPVRSPFHFLLCLGFASFHSRRSTCVCARMCVCVRFERGCKCARIHTYVLCVRDVCVCPVCCWWWCPRQILTKKLIPSVLLGLTGVEAEAYLALLRICMYIVLLASLL